MLLDKLLTLAIGLIFLLALSCDGPTAESEQKTAATNATLYSDSPFWDYAASSNLMQVELGQLALERGETDNVKTRAEAVLKFHDKALKQLQAMTKATSLVKLPDSLTGADRELVEEFKALETEEFNTRYKAFLVSSHQTQMARYQEALQKADEQELRDWLKQMLAHLQEELTKISATDTLQEERL